MRPGPSSASLAMCSVVTPPARIQSNPQPFRTSFQADATTKLVTGMCNAMWLFKLHMCTLTADLCMLGALFVDGNLLSMA